MTTERIDVLAVMDLAFRHLNGGDDTLTTAEFTAAHAGMKEARAAVAELIEAAGNYATRYAMDEASVDGDEHTGCSHQQHLDAVALFAALSRCGGAK